MKAASALSLVRKQIPLKTEPERREKAPLEKEKGEKRQHSRINPL